MATRFKPNANRMEAMTMPADSRNRSGMGMIGALVALVIAAIWIWLVERGRLQRHRSDGLIRHSVALKSA